MAQRFGIASIGFLVTMIVSTIVVYSAHEGKTLSKRLAAVTYGGGTYEGNCCYYNWSCDIPSGSVDCSTKGSEDCPTTCEWEFECSQPTNEKYLCQAEEGCEPYICNEGGESYCLQCRVCKCNGNLCYKSGQADPNNPDAKNPATCEYWLK